MQPCTTHKAPTRLCPGVGDLGVFCSTAVLAGGLATRLRPVLNGQPKAMAPVGGHPFLAYVLAFVRSAGLTDVVLCVSYQRSQIRRCFGQGKKYGVKLSYAVEPSPLGTGGALRNAIHLFSKNTVIVLNGDSLVDLDLGAMFEFHRRHDAAATIALARVSNAERFGSVIVDRQGRICEFSEKKKTSQARESDQINAGVYMFERRILMRIPGGRPVSLEKDFFPKLAGNGLYGFSTTGFFLDIGVPEEFRAAQFKLRTWKVT